MTGGGRDIWSNEDSFFFAKVSILASDFTAVVFTEDGFTNEDSYEWAKFNLMVRDSMDPKSQQFSAVLSAERGVHAMYRPSYGSLSYRISDYDNHRGGCWLKVTRSGDTFKAYYKPKDENNYILLGEQTIEMEGAVEIGLGLSSHA